MTDTESIAAIEAVLFAAGNPVSVDTLADALGAEVAHIQLLLAQYEEQLEAESRGIMLRYREDAVQLCTKPAHAEIIEAILSPLQKRSLSAAVMEVLTIIAYKQPVTRVEIEDIRGVRCEYALQVLDKLGLIAEVGRKDTLGRPVLYGTTREFLRTFDIASLSKLPALQFEKPEEGVQQRMELPPTENGQYGAAE